MVPDPPVVITGSYSPSTPAAPAAAGGSYSAGTPTAPAAPGGSYSPSTPARPATPGTGPAVALRLAYDQPDDMPSGRFRLLGASSVLGDVWVLEGDLGNVLMSDAGELSGSGTVWVQRFADTFAWSMENSSDWANVSPSVYLQQLIGDTSRSIHPTPAAVAVRQGAWLDVINDWDPEEEGVFALSLEAVGTPAAPGSSYSPSTPAAPPAIS